MGANSQSSCKFHHRDTGSPDGRLPFLRLFEASCNKHFTEQVTQGDVAAALQRQVDASLDELFFARRHSFVKPDQVTFPNAVGQRAEELLQSWERGEKLTTGEGMFRYQMAWNQICQDQPVSVSQNLQKLRTYTDSRFLEAPRWHMLQAVAKCCSA